MSIQFPAVRHYAEPISNRFYGLIEWNKFLAAVNVALRNSSSALDQSNLLRYVSFVCNIPTPDDGILTSRQRAAVLQSLSDMTLNLCR